MVDIFQSDLNPILMDEIFLKFTCVNARKLLSHSVKALVFYENSGQWIEQRSVL